MDLVLPVCPVRRAAKKVKFTKKHAQVSLADGRVMSILLKLYPRSQNATDAQRKIHE